MRASVSVVHACARLIYGYTFTSVMLIGPLAVPPPPLSLLLSQPAGFAPKTLVFPSGLGPRHSSFSSRCVRAVIRLWIPYPFSRPFISKGLIVKQFQFTMKNVQYSRMDRVRSNLNVIQRRRVLAPLNKQRRSRSFASRRRPFNCENRFLLSRHPKESAAPGGMKKVTSKTFKLLSLSVPLR